MGGREPAQIKIAIKNLCFVEFTAGIAGIVLYITSARAYARATAITGTHLQSLQKVGHGFDSAALACRTNIRRPVGEKACLEVEF